MEGIRSTAASGQTYAGVLASSRRLSQSVQRLSSGLRINSAADDAAGLAVSENLTTQIRGLNVASRNSSDAISMLQVAEAAMAEISDMLQRRREITLQVVNGTLPIADKINADEEYAMLSAEIFRIVENMSYGDYKLFDGSQNSISIQIGAFEGQQLEFDLPDLRNDPDFYLGAVVLGNTSGAGTGPAGTYPDNIRITALDHIDKSLQSLNTARASIGAGLNRVESAIAQISAETTAYSESRARIMDADMAEEAAAVAKSWFQQQAAFAMSKQVGSNASRVLALIQ